MATGGPRASAFPGARASTVLGGAEKLTVAIGREAALNFRAWFERNFMNPRAGRVGGVSYARAGALDDRPGDPAWYSDAYGRAFWDHTEPLSPDEEDYLRSHPLVLLQLALGVTDLRGLRCLRRGLTLRANALQQKAYRSRYYAQDNARRRELAAERRKIRRRTTLSPCPTPDEFRAAFARAKESAEAKIRFGGMVHDLACYVDSCLRYDGSGNIVGRNGGIRAWIVENVPELSPRYKTIMRHKALAMRARQLTGLEDPQPTSVLLDGPADGRGENSDGEARQAFGTGAKGRGGEVERGSGTGTKGRGNGDGKSSGTCSKGRESKTESQNGSGKSEGQVGLKNYYAQDSHFSRKRDGVMQKPNGLERERNGAYGPERKRDRLQRVLEQRRGQPRLALEQQRERLRRVLAECRNTFKDVFDRIDSELG